MIPLLAHPMRVFEHVHSPPLVLLSTPASEKKTHPKLHAHGKGVPVSVSGILASTNVSPMSKINASQMIVPLNLRRMAIPGSTLPSQCLQAHRNRGLRIEKRCGSPRIHPINGLVTGVLPRRKPHDFSSIVYKRRKDWLCWTGSNGRICRGAPFPAVSSRILGIASRVGTGGILSYDWAPRMAKSHVRSIREWHLHSIHDQCYFK